MLLLCRFEALNFFGPHLEPSVHYIADIGIRELII